MTPRRRRQEWTGVGPDIETLTAVLERLPVGVAILSLPDLVFEYVNPAFQAFAPEKPMLGKSNGEVFPEMQSLAPSVLATLATGGTWREEKTSHSIRRSPNGPLETVYGTFEVSRLDFGGRTRLLVIATETTDQVSLMRENTELREEEVGRLSFAETLGRVYRVIHSSLDYDEVMQRALEEGTRALGANAGAVFIGEDDESEARYIFGFPRSLLGRRLPAAIFPFTTMMRESSEPIPIEAEQMGELMNPSIARIFRVRAVLAIPVFIRNELRGGIGLAYRKPHRFTKPEIDFARSFGGSLSLALENAELYRRQERVADTLQRALLTLPESITGLRFAHAYRSATEAVQVGGDFYDLFELEHETVGMTLGDIAGKGLDAAVLTSLVKNAIRVQATEKRSSPAEVMRLVNEVVVSGSQPEEFATVFFGLLDCASGRLLYCNAGHTTAGLICRDSSIRRLGANSSLVGAFPNSLFRDSEATLHHGELLFLYTDGLIEARRGREQFGEERLFELLSDAGSEDPESVVDLVVDAVSEFTRGSLGDDVAVLAVRRE